MIIQLKGVTFNADVIFGKSVELSESVKALFSDNAYTRSVTNKQKEAVQIAIESLVQEGLWDKIDVLYLPILAGKVDEAFINLKRTYGQKTVIKDRFITDIEQSLSISESGGINLANKEFTNYGSGISYKTTAGSFHYGFIYSPLRQACGFNTSQFSLVFKTSSGGLRALSSMQINGNEAKLSVNDSELINLTKENSPVLIGFNESGTANLLMNMNNYQEFAYNSSYPYSYDYTNSMTAFPCCTDAGVMKNLSGVRFVTMGKHLTQSEMEKYSQIINELLTAF